jgi:hypothetical protein
MSNIGEADYVDSRSCLPDKKCRYEVVYGDQSQTDSNLACDTLMLGMPWDTLVGFLFRCGDKDTGPDCLDGIGLEHGNTARGKIPIRTLLDHGAPIKIGLESID